MKYCITLGLALICALGHRMEAMEKVKCVLGADKVSQETKQSSMKESLDILYYDFPGASSPVYSIEELDRLKNDATQSLDAERMQFASYRR